MNIPQIKISEPPSYSTILPKWGNKYLVKLFNDFGALCNEVEIDMLTSGKRDADIYHMYPDEYDKQMEQIREKGLIFLPIHRVKRYSGFAHKLDIVNNLSSDTMVYGVIAKDINTAKRFAKYTNGNDHLNIGLMLGYPECCCQAFVDYSKQNMDPVFEIACNTPCDPIGGKNKVVLNGVAWELQAHLRYFGVKVIPWFPCSFVCDESREAAKAWINMLKQKDEKMFEEIESILKTPSIWDLYNCQVVVNRPPHKESKFFGYATSYYYPERRVVEFMP